EGWEDARIRDGGVVAPDGGYDNTTATYAGYNANQAPFYHGVASGDPTQNSIIIWTRVTPDDRAKEHTATSIDVDWYFSSSPDLSGGGFSTNIIRQGTFSTNQDRDFTVKVAIENLTSAELVNPDGWYYYIFSAQGKWSVLGRTKLIQGNPTQMRFGVVSCSNIAEGYFNAYDALNQRNDVDIIYHLGDYIYEYEDNHYGTFRGYAPPYEMVAIEDYRSRFSIYRLEPEQQQLHQNYPWSTTWDDHESTNDSWVGGAENHQPNDPYKPVYCADATEGDWTVRKGNSKKAYDEWMPIKMQGDRDNAPSEMSLYRKFTYGDFAEVYFLDTRLEGREEQLGPDTPQTDPNRTLLGAQQYDWLVDNMKIAQDNGIKWKVLAQQVMFANFDTPDSSLGGSPINIPGTPAAPSLAAINMDQWDGYTQERQKLMNQWNTDGVDNIVILTGDIHTSWANEVPNGRDAYAAATQLTPCQGTQAVEFVVTSVTSPGLDGTEPALVPAAQANNPHMKYIELTDHGFMIFDLTAGKAQGDWYYVNTIRDRNYSILTAPDKAVSWFTNVGESCMNDASSMRTSDQTPNPALMPVTPPASVAGLTPRTAIALTAQTGCPHGKCPNNDALPIVLTDWYGQQEGKTNVLYWETTSEANNSHFVLERSVDGERFEVLTKVIATTDKSTATRYQFVDQHPANGFNYYRLTQVDKAGMHSIFNTIIIKTHHQFEQ
ncbi:MAG: alkaline phosphatase D family protein, partial [Bacteroidota bacterium]